MKERKSILGRGLEELFEAQDTQKAKIVGQIGVPMEIPIHDLAPGKSQPRKMFAQDKIDQLSDSIKESGILQPIIVRLSTTGDKKYEIIAGERRWLAAKQAGNNKVPVIIKELTDRESLKLAIIENVQREDLNILEEAESYQRLIDEHQYTQEMIGKEVGKSRSHVANTLRLLNLPEEIKDFVASGKISAGHARALINSEDALTIAKEIIENKLNVRDAEKKSQHAGALTTSEELQDLANLQQRLQGVVKGAVKVTMKKRQIAVQITFQDPWDFEELLEKLEK